MGHFLSERCFVFYIMHIMSNKKASYLATANKACTIVSPSPYNLEVREEALILKTVALDCDAMHFTMSVFPVPDGPKSKTPFGGYGKPEKISGLNNGHTATSWK
jgi:hypothetical protein